MLRVINKVYIKQMKEKLNIDDIIKRFNIYHNNYYTYYL